MLKAAVFVGGLILAGLRTAHGLIPTLELWAAGAIIGSVPSRKALVPRHFVLLSIPVMIVLAGLAARASRPAHAAFRGTNGKIVFSRQGGGQRLEIFAMNPDGSDQTNLTNNPALDYAPAGSPDGRRIAFIRCEEICHLFVMNADGSGQRRLTNDPGPDYFATWSPDGRRIAFARGDGDIWVMNADGSNPEEPD
jgi:WD40 repeat protein